MKQITKRILISIGLIMAGLIQFSVSCQSQQFSISGSSQLFIPEIFENREVHASPAFSPDGKEMYWSQHLEDEDRMQIFFSVKNNDNWSEPQTASFSGVNWDDDPAFSADGNTIYFMSRKMGGGPTDIRIWKTSRIDDRWGEPVSTGISGDQPTLDKDDNLYFCSRMYRSMGDMDFYILPAGKDIQKIENLGSPVNSAASEFTPWISNDGNKLIFSSYNRPKGNGLFIAYKMADGKWGMPEFIDKKFDVDGFKRFPRFLPEGGGILFNCEGRIYFAK